MGEPAGGFVFVGGLRLYHLDWGGTGKPALVLLHDLGQSADVWRPLAPRLTERFHVVAPDMRGHGDSDWIDTYSPQEQGDDIGELIEVLRLAPAAVMGLGMGARAGALLAARQEHNVARLVMVNAGVRMYLPAFREASNAIIGMERVYPSPEGYERHWWELRHRLGMTNRPEPDAHTGGHASSARLLQPRAGGGFSPKFDADGYARYREWSPGERAVDYHDEFDQIACPVLLVRGADNPLFSSTDAEETVQAIPDTRMIELPHARHDILADNPDGLLDAVLPFLAGKG